MNNPQDIMNPQLLELIAQQVYDNSLGWNNMGSTTIPPNTMVQGGEFMPMPSPIQQGQPEQSGQNILSLLAGIVPQYRDPNEQENKDILRQAIMAAGAGMLSAPLGNFTQGLGAAGSAFLNTRNSLQEQLQRRLDSRAESSARGEYNKRMVDYYKSTQESRKDPAAEKALADKENAASWMEQVPDAGIKITDPPDVVRYKVAKAEEASGEAKAQSSRDTAVGELTDFYMNDKVTPGEISPDEQRLINIAEGSEGDPSNWIRSIITPDQDMEDIGDMLFPDVNDALAAVDQMVAQALGDIGPTDPDSQRFAQLRRTLEANPKLARRIATDFVVGQYRSLSQDQLAKQVRMLLQRLDSGQGLDGTMDMPQRLRPEQ